MHRKQLVLIAGGDGKGQDFSAPLADPVARYVRAVLLIGKDAGSIRDAMQATGVELIDCTHWKKQRRKLPNWRRQAMRCCCRRPAPASTCSRTMRIARSVCRRGA
jgi:UDP-N-acetylmuramoylalanine-D-glutamate ligase